MKQSNTPNNTLADFEFEEDINTGQMVDTVNEPESTFYGWIQNPASNKEFGVSNQISSLRKLVAEATKVDPRYDFRIIPIYLRVGGVTLLERSPR